MAKTIHSFYAVGMFALASLAAILLAPGDTSAAVSLRVLLGDEWHHRQVGSWNGNFYRFDVSVG